MAKPTQIDKAIASLDEQIAALQFARQHLVAQRNQAKPAPKGPRPVGKPEERSAS